MAFDIATTTPATTASGTTHSITLPSHQSGDLLVAIYGVASQTGQSDTINTGSSTSGWTAAQEVRLGTAKGIIVWKVADSGSEVLVMSCNYSKQAAQHVYRIRNFSGTPSFGTGVAAASSTPNPPRCPPGTAELTSAEYLWIVSCVPQQYGITAAPTDFTDLASVSPPGSSNVGCGSARRLYTGTSLDPGAFSITGSNNWAAHTIAIAPAAGGVSVSSVSDTSLDNGQTSVTITGSGFKTSQGTGKVIISPTDNVADTSAVKQVVTTWSSDTSITFTAVRGALQTGNHYLFVVNSDGESNTSGSIVTFNGLTPIILRWNM